MNAKTNKTSVKMVWVAGLLVREDQVENRLKALARGRNLKKQLLQDQKDEDRRLKDEGLSPEEIACLRHANRIRTMETMGLGTSQRCRIGFPGC